MNSEPVVSHELNDDDQLRFSAALAQLIRTYYGTRAKYALAVFISEGRGVRVLTSSDAPDPTVMASMFDLAAMAQHKVSRTRQSIIEDDEGVKQ